MLKCTLKVDSSSNIHAEMLVVKSEFIYHKRKFAFIPLMI